MIEKKLLRSYITGFVLSIVLTGISFTLTLINVHAEHAIVSREVLLPSILVLALTQLVVQLIFFLHLLTEKKPRWQMVFFISTIGIIFIVVVGSLWIMTHLNYNMTPQQMEQYTQSQDGF